MQTDLKARTPGKVLMTEQKFKSSKMPRPRSAVVTTSISSKPLIVSPIAIKPLESTRYKTFKEESYTSRELHVLRRQSRADTHQEFPYRHNKTVKVNRIPRKALSKPKETNDWMSTVRDIMKGNPPSTSNAKAKSFFITRIKNAKPKKLIENNTVDVNWSIIPTAKPQKVIATPLRMKLKRKNSTSVDPVLGVRILAQSSQLITRKTDADAKFANKSQVTFEPIII